VPSLPSPQLGRVRWAVRGVLTVGVAASVAANVLHARPHPVSQVIAAWPPLALLLTVELISRVPVHRPSLAMVRLAATATIAGIAAWVSYWHMAGVAARYGETGASPNLLPLSVDGLIIVASISLVELAGHIRANEPPTEHGLVPTTATDVAPPDPDAPTGAGGQDHGIAAMPLTIAPAPEAAGEPPAGDERTDAAAQDAAPRSGELSVQRLGPRGRTTPGSTPGSGQPHTSHARGTGSAVTDVVASTRPTSLGPDATPSRRRSAGTTRAGASAETVAAVAAWRTRDPRLRPDEIAARIGRSPRQVRRALAVLNGRGATIRPLPTARDGS
jgi:hypothetical protein